MNIAVVNTKGGVGKTTIASMIIPLMFAEEAESGKKVNVFHVADNASAILVEDSIINFKTAKIDDVAKVVDSVKFNAITDKDSINIIDCGDKHETVTVLEDIKKTNAPISTYIIPIIDDIELINHIKQTVSLIKSIDADAKIVLMLNRVIGANEAYIAPNGEIYTDEFATNEFAWLDKSLIDEFAQVAIVPELKVLKLLKNIYRTTALDKYISSKELVNTFKSGESRAKAAEKGLEEYKKLMVDYRFARNIHDLHDDLSVLKSAITQ